MPKKLEDCVSKITGTNPRTKKPFTKSEKYAICNARLKNGKSSLDEISSEVANATFNYASQLFKSGKVDTMENAYELTQVVLTKNNYNYKVLELIVGN